MQWHLKEFKDLSLEQLYSIIRLRSEVFVVEQDCVYLDIDGYDRDCLHLWCEDRGSIVALTRILPPGVYYQEASVGRVLVAEKYRGKDLGRELMRRSEEALFSLGHHGPIKLMAQSYLLSWYASQGYEAQGEDFLEDGIPHRIVVKKGP